MNLMTRGNQPRHQLLADRSRRSCNEHSHHQPLSSRISHPTRQDSRAGCDTAWATVRKPVEDLKPDPGGSDAAAAGSRVVLWDSRRRLPEEFLGERLAIEDVDADPLIRSSEVRQERPDLVAVTQSRVVIERERRDNHRHPSAAPRHNVRSVAGDRICPCRGFASQPSRLHLLSQLQGHGDGGPRSGRERGVGWRAGRRAGSSGLLGLEGRCVLAHPVAACAPGGARR